MVEWMTHFEYEFEVSFGHCDPAGIVYYPNYFDWFDTGTHFLMSAAGVGQRAQNEKLGILGCGLLSVSCDFRRPATFGDKLRHRVSVSEWNSSNFVVSHVLTRADETVAEGKEKRACLVREAGGKIRAIAIPVEFRQAIDALTVSA
jgi:4-hydroxybenzoyl-CoA thioesterase